MLQALNLVIITNNPTRLTYSQSANRASSNGHDEFCEFCLWYHSRMIVTISLSTSSTHWWHLRITFCANCMQRWSSNAVCWVATTRVFAVPYSLVFSTRGTEWIQRQRWCSFCHLHHLTGFWNAIFSCIEALLERMKRVALFWVTVFPSWT